VWNRIESRHRRPDRGTLEIELSRGSIAARTLGGVDIRGSAEWRHRRGKPSLVDEIGLPSRIRAMDATRFGSTSS
jgi:hypothetical protein